MVIPPALHHSRTVQPETIMTSSLYTTRSIEPDFHVKAVAKPRSLVPITSNGHTSLFSASRRIKVTAIVTRRPDLTEVTTYQVEEVDDLNSSCDELPPLTSRPLLGHRRSRSHSQSTILSDDDGDHMCLQTPSPSALGSPDALPITPPGAPHIPFPPSPQLTASESSHPITNLSSRRGVGLGLDLTGCQPKKQSTVTYSKENRWGPIGEGRGRPRAASFNPFATPVSLDEEEPYYHLPANLFSPELEMSAAEFKRSVISWVERRKRANTYH